MRREQILKEKRSIKVNNALAPNSKRVKITPPEKPPTLNVNVENVPLLNNHLANNTNNVNLNTTPNLNGLANHNLIMFPNNTNTLNTNYPKKQGYARSSGKAMEVESKKKFSFDSKPYSNDVHASQFLTEKRFFAKVGNGIIWEGNPINPAMRSILVNWLTEVVEEYKMRSQTLFLAVCYLDRFLQSTKEIHRHLLQLVGVTCLWIAAKFEEIDVPDVEEFVYITDNTYTAQEIISTERYILNKLDYDLACVTIENFLYRFLEVGGVPVENSFVILHAKFIAELSLTCYPITKMYHPSLLAASIVCIVKQANNIHPVCSQQFLHYTNCSKEQLVPCIQHLTFTSKSLVAHPSPTALVEKYKKEKFRHVADIFLHENIEL